MRRLLARLVAPEGPVEKALVGCMAVGVGVGLLVAGGPWVVVAEVARRWGR